MILKLKSSHLSHILVLIWPLSSNSRYKSKNDADEAVSVVSLTSSSGTKPGHHTVTSFTKPGPAILTWPISFAPCLLISIIKSTKWRFLSSLFINRSFNTFRSIQCEQFKEKLSEIRGWGQSDRHIAAHYRLFLNYDDIAKMFHMTAGYG